MKVSAGARSGRVRQTGFRLAGVLLLGIAFALTPTTSASADILFGLPSGSGAGQTNIPMSVAVDRSNGTVYVADRDNNRVDVFKADGTFLRAFGWGVADGTTAALQTCTLTCFKGLQGPGQLNAPTSLAVDNDPTSPAFHDIYVLGSGTVQKFEPSGSLVGSFSVAGSKIAVGTGGVIYAAKEPNTVQKFDASGNELAKFSLSPAGLGSNLNGFATDPTGNFYVASAGTTGAVRKYDSNGTLLSTVNPSFNIMEVGTDSSSNLYVSDAQAGLAAGARAIYEYDPSGTLFRVFYGDVQRRLISVAPYSDSSGDVVAVQEHAFPTGAEFTGDNVRAIVRIPFPAAGPVVPPGLTQAKPIGSVKATLNSALNPEGKSSTYHFQYVDQAGFESGGFSNPATKVTAESASVGSDFAMHPAVAAVSGLTPETKYHFRAVVTSSAGTAFGPEGTFVTLAPVLITDTWSTGVDTDGATLHVTTSPGVPATGYFEYVEQSSYEASGFAEASETPDVSGGSSPIDLGAEEEVKNIASQAYPLSPGVTYAYRFVAESAFGTLTGPVRAFTTFRPRDESEDTCPNRAYRTGASASLPDCRAYEMVSPLDKSNGDIISPISILGFPVHRYQATADGEKLAYTSYRAFGDAQSAPYASQYIATRGEGGWSTEGIAPPQGVSQSSGFSLDNPYLASTPNLSDSWFLYVADPPLTPDAPNGVWNIYRRDNGTESFEPLNTVVPPHPKRRFEPELQGVSANAEHAVFIANDNLTTNARSTEIKQLYESTAGGPLRLVSVLPDGTASKESSSAGNGAIGIRNSTLTHALSADGSRVYWSTTAGLIFLRQNADLEQSPIASGQCTEALTKACTYQVLPEAATFWLAAVDGSRAILTSKKDLYEFDANSKKANLIAKEVDSVLGASDDASRVYFFSKLVLTGAEENSVGATAEAGKPNLYFREAGTAPAYVTTLTGSEGQPNLSPELGDANLQPFYRSSRVSPDGLHVAFMSTASLTGYDNTDAASKKRDAEVFVYDAPANGAEGALRCASCNPSGGRPTGRSLNRVNDVDVAWTAARIFGWDTALYPNRYLADDGSRVFFESYDSLTPRDTNGRVDVYQWEAPGAGSCDESSSTFSPLNGGCVTLVSSGESPEDSSFVDAGASGDDVFITTSASLVPQDFGLVDIYDAKVGGGYPAPSGPPASCEGEACQNAPEAPNDPTPASSSFEGAGNVSEPPAARKPRPCAKGKVRRKGRCVVRKPKRANHRRRAAR